MFNGFNFMFTSHISNKESLRSIGRHLAPQKAIQNQLVQVV